MSVLSLVLSSIFFILGIIHLSWALGSRWAFDKALPTTTDGKKLFSPGKMASAVVGLGLISFGIFYLFISDRISLQLPYLIRQVVKWIIPVIFFLRAVGDRRYAGFFKKIRNTEFGKLDTRIYSPLCLFIAVSGLLINLDQTEHFTELNLRSQFAHYGVEGCFVLFDEAKNQYYVYNESNCDKGYIPASTFKIPHSLIVLEEGLIQDTNQIIQWDGVIRPVKSWNQDQNLKSAVSNSCVWVFVGFAENLGIDTYQKYIEEFNYGNKNISGRPSSFWLTGLLRINAFQQIEFLKRMYNYKLPVSQKNIDLVKQILINEKFESGTLSGKTGAGVLSENTYVMWYVGYFETGNKTWYFAMNFITDDYEASSSARKEIVKSVLMELGILKL